MADDFVPRLVFKYPFDAMAAHDAEARGYLGYAAVELGDGRRYPVVFYDPVRLQQDLEVETGEGRAFIAEPGRIVVPEVTLFRMRKRCCVFLRWVFSIHSFMAIHCQPAHNDSKNRT